jgi:hypothetical protein
LQLAVTWSLQTVNQLQGIAKLQIVTPPFITLSVQQVVAIRVHAVAA